MRCLYQIKRCTVKAPGAPAVRILAPHALNPRRNCAIFAAMEQPDPLLGQTLGNYHVQSRVGAGAMGQVFLGVHPRIDRKVAIKVLEPHLSARPDMSERFLAEARAVNHINHPHIVQVFDFGTLPDGRLYLIMEFLEGEDLGRHLARRGPLSLSEVLVLVRQIAAALDAAHEAGIIHRDLKPDNVFLLATKTGPTVKLVDFGIAKLLEPELRGGGHTATGLIMGTPAYMSPEQAMGNTEGIRAASDIYSLAVMTYQMLSGRLPFEAAYVPHVLVKHVSEPPTPISTYVPGFPPALWSVLERALAKDPAQRPPTAGDFFQDLAAAAATVDSSQLAGTFAVPSGGTPVAAPAAALAPPALASGVAIHLGASTTTAAGQLDGPAPPAGKAKRRLTWGTVVVAFILGSFLIPRGRCSYSTDGDSSGGTKINWSDPARMLALQAPAPPAGAVPAPPVPAPPVTASPPVTPPAAGPDDRPQLYKFVITAATAGIPVQVQVNAEKPFTVNTPFTYYAPKNAVVIITSTHPQYRESTQSFTAVQDLEVKLTPSVAAPAMTAPTMTAPAMTPATEIRVDVPEPDIPEPDVPGVPDAPMARVKRPPKTKD